MTSSSSFSECHDRVGIWTCIFPYLVWHSNNYATSTHYCYTTHFKKQCGISRIVFHFTLTWYSKRMKNTISDNFTFFCRPPYCILCNASQLFSSNFLWASRGLQCKVGKVHSVRAFLLTVLFKIQPTDFIDSERVTASCPKTYHWKTENNSEFIHRAQNSLLSYTPCNIIAFLNISVFHWQLRH